MQVVSATEQEITPEILAACRRGDRDAFRRLYEAYKDKVYSIALYFFHGDAATADKLDADVQQLAGEISKVQSDRTRVADSAAALRNTLDALAQRLTTTPVDRAVAVRYVRAITDDAERIANGGERAAEQAAMSLETLLGALAQNAAGVDAAAARTALDRLFQQLENPSGYDPRRFAPQLRRISDLLPR